MKGISYLVLGLAVIGLVLGIGSSDVYAEGSLLLNKVASTDAALLGDNITYTYTISNNGTVEISDITLKDDKLGSISLPSDNASTVKLAPGENITATAGYKVAFSDVLAGSIKNTATVTGVDTEGNTVTASSGEVSVSTNVLRALLTKAQVLILSGVPGKGIENAPGLQKPFNPNSQAAEHAGKKDGQGNMEKNKNQETSDGSGQNQETELNGNTVQNQEQEMNQGSGKGQGKGNSQGQDKGNGQGKNKK